MSPTQEDLFRFLSLRQPQRLLRHRIDERLVRDFRPNLKGSLHNDLFGAAEFDQRLARAEAYLRGPAFLPAGAPEIRVADPTTELLSAVLQPGVALDDLDEQLRVTFPEIDSVVKGDPETEVVRQLAVFAARLWDSFYALTVKGFAGFTQTNYLADTIRSLHVLRLYRLHVEAGETTWRGHRFVDYDLIIAPRRDAERPGGDADPVSEPKPPRRDDGPAGPLERERQRLVAELGRLREAGAVLDRTRRANQQGRRGGAGRRQKDALSQEARAALVRVAMPGADDTAQVPDIGEAGRRIAARRQEISNRIRQIRIALANGGVDAPGHRPLGRWGGGDAPVPAPAPGDAVLSAQATSIALPGFFTDGDLDISLSVGRIRPPLVGDMILVEQELKAYEMGELASIENVLKGERREYTTRTLSRSTQSSSSTRETETTESESVKTDERFQMSLSATEAAENAFAADLGVSVSGKYGPVSIAMTANASYSQSRSSSETRAQETARQVTEEAAKSVRNLVRESSALTLMEEVEKTSRHGFNNEGGTGHVSGLYRWIDKLYNARSVNYGRRLMLTFDVPEPAALLHAAFEAAEESELVEPIAPEDYYTLPSGSVGHAGLVSGVEYFTDHTVLNEKNFGKLAAKYDVTDITPPPPDKITRAKAIAYPEAATAEDIKDHQQAGNELSYVAADNSLRVDPDYKINRIGVWATKGNSGGFGWYADTNLLGVRNNDENTLLVLVGNKSFHFHASKDGNDARDIITDFNRAQEVGENELFGDAVVDTLPVTIQADFEGLFTFNVIYTALLRPEAFEAWQIRTWAAILQGYQRKKKEYDQLKRLADNAAEAEVAETTLVLRDSQYREIERTELKRGCIDILTEGTAIGIGALERDADGTPLYPTEDAPDLRSPLTNGVIAAFFEESFEWEQMTYRFYPYYWADRGDWQALRAMQGADPIFEGFLKSGQATVTVSVKPGNERAVVMFLKTGRIWTGGYLALFDNIDSLTVYDDVENGLMFDPPVQVGAAWPVRLPSSLIRLQADDALPEFETSFELGEPETDFEPSAPGTSSDPVF